MTAGVTWVSATAWVSNPQMPIVQGLVARVLHWEMMGPLGARTLGQTRRPFVPREESERFFHHSPKRGAI